MHVFLLVFLVVTINGCATLFGDKEKNFSLKSEPPDADVYLDGNRLGTTPVTVRLSNHATHVFVFRRSGYREATCILSRSTDAGWVILDILGGIIPIGIDAATSDWSQTKGKECFQTLEPLDPMSHPLAESQPVPADTAPPRAVVVAHVGPGSAAAKHARSGFWFNAGLGYGSFGCPDCDGREGSLSGALAMGGTVSRKIAIGGGTTNWYKSENGTTQSIGTVVALLRFYPSSTGQLFLLGGLGLGHVQTEFEDLGKFTETGWGGLLGLGYDIRIGANTSLTPYWNGFLVSTSSGHANVGQIGLGLTIH